MAVFGVGLDGVSITLFTQSKGFCFAQFRANSKDMGLKIEHDPPFKIERILQDQAVQFVIYVAYCRVPI